MSRGRQERGDSSCLTRSQRLSRGLKKLKTSIKGVFSGKSRPRKSQGRAIPDLRREAIEKRRKGTYWSTALRTKLPPTQPAQQLFPSEGKHPVQGPASTLVPERRLRRKPVFSRDPEASRQLTTPGASYQQRPLPPLPPTRATPYLQRPLPPLPTTQGSQHRREDVRMAKPPPTYRRIFHYPPGRGYRKRQCSRIPGLEVELPPPEHGSSSPLFPAPLNPRRVTPRRLVRHDVTRNPLVEELSRPPDALGRSESFCHSGHSSFQSGGSVARSEPETLGSVPVTAGQAPERGHFSRARPMSLDFNNNFVADHPLEGEPSALPHRESQEANRHYTESRVQNAPERELSTLGALSPQHSNKTLPPIPRHSFEKRPSAPRHANKPASLPSPRPAPVPLRHNAPMHRPAVSAVVTWLRDNLAHVPYVVTSLSALSIWGFTSYLPTHVSILCPEHCRDVVTSWAVATGVVLYPRQEGFGLQLRGEEGHVRRVRVRFVGAEDFAGFRTVGGGRVLSLASLVDVLAGEFMDMTGERVGEKRVMLGDGIMWAVEKMKGTEAAVGKGEVRNVGNPLFLEPFDCTFPGSRELLARAELIEGDKEPPQPRSWMGSKKGSVLRKAPVDWKHRAASRRVP